MLFDEIAELFNRESHRAIARRTGLSRGKVDSLQHGCSFVLDLDFLRALDALGYELRLLPVTPPRGGARRPSRAENLPRPAAPPRENPARRETREPRRKDVRISGQAPW